MNHHSIEAIERRDVRRARRQGEIDRIDAIDMLADRLLCKAEYDGVPATEVWDIAATMIDKRIDEREARA